MSTRQKDEQPTRVPPKAKPAGEIRDRWSWVEPGVWTERMLTALENGVRGGKWHSLRDKVYSPANLQSAFAMVKANQGSAGVDHEHGFDHFRWPNAFFTEHGLFFLSKAHASACQSAHR